MTLVKAILTSILFTCWAWSAQMPWDYAALTRVPAMQTVPTQEPGVRAVLYESVPWKGKPTRVFAYYGVPAGASANSKVPAMVLIHGGGGTAFAEWVRQWNRRGYAAIAMDTCGAIPDKAPDGKPFSPEKKHHETGGPAGWGGFDQIDSPPADQWTYHAVASVLLAHSLLRSFPEVDARRTGVTGISWGGYLTNIVAGVDPRFRFAAPVYGCGFLGEDSAWLTNFEKMGKERASRWLGLWDPSEYVGRAKMPMLWVSGTNDFAYPLPSLQKSYRLPHVKRTLAIRVRMPHGHPQGAAPEEIAAFADAILRHGKPLAEIRNAGLEGSEAYVRFRSARPVVKAELNYTAADGVWKERKWETAAATLDAKRGSARAQIPAGTKVYYFNLFDKDGLVVSSEHAVQ